MMNIARLILALLFVVGSAMTPPALAGDIEAWQERLFVALKRQHILSAGLRLVTADYVCTLRVGAADWRVINTVEHAQNAEVPRAYNQIVILDRRLKLIRSLPYAGQRPLFCRGARLFVFGDYGIDNTEPYGNTLTFHRNGAIGVSETDVNALPIEPTGKRRTYRVE